MNNIYLIADMKINFELQSKLMKTQLEKYQIDSDVFDIKITSIIKEELTIKGTLKQTTHSYELYDFDEGVLQVQYDKDHQIIGEIFYQEKGAQIYLLKKYLNKEFLLSEYAIVYFILKNKDAMFIHGSSFIYKDLGIMLIAPSQLGKSTHASLWREYENVTMINDDKNFILNKDNILYLYPNPWSGRYLLDNNIIHKLDVIVSLKRSDVCSIRRLSKKEAFILTMPRMVNTSFFYDADKWDKMTDLLINNTKYYELCCNISKEAVLTLKNILEEDYEIK